MPCASGLHSGLIYLFILFVCLVASMLLANRGDQSCFTSFISR